MMKFLARCSVLVLPFCLASSIPGQDPVLPAPATPADAPSPKTDTPKDPAASVPTRAQDLLIVVGSGGTPDYEKQFSEWSKRLIAAAGEAGISSTFIGPQTEAGSSTSNAAGAGGKSDLDQLQQSLAELSSYATPEPLWLVYFGHGTYDGREAMLNLRGVDVSDRQLAEALKDAKRPIAVVLCSSCSSPFINALSGPNRVIISATKDGNQVQFSRFGDAFTKAIGTLDADINRDGQTSLLEAWLFASRRTADFYKSEGRLATEHALLDDNGDQLGTRAENFEGDRLKSSLKNASEMDGRLATRWTLVRSDDEKKLSPEQRSQRDELEARIEILRSRRDSMDEPAYLAELESLLRPLAAIYEAAEKGNSDNQPPAEKL